MRRRQFGREFKIEAVRLIKDRGVSVAQASRDLDVHENQLRKWVKLFSADPAQAFPDPGQMKPEQLEIERLRRPSAARRTSIHKAIDPKCSRSSTRTCRVMPASSSPLPISAPETPTSSSIPSRGPSLRNAIESSAAIPRSSRGYSCKPVSSRQTGIGAQEIGSGRPS